MTSHMYQVYTDQYFCPKTSLSLVVVNELLCISDRAPTAIFKVRGLLLPLPAQTLQAVGARRDGCIRRLCV